MDRRVMDYLMDKMDSRRGDRRDRERAGGSREARDYEDERRGVKGTGPYGIGGSKYPGRDYEDERDYEDTRRRFSYEDGHERFRLTKSDMHHWKQKLENVDGTWGPHYDMQQVMNVADKLGVKFKDFSEAEFCMAVNMMYADYCRTIKKHVDHEKMLECCAELALDFLDDPDGPEPGEKLALYYHCIVNA